MSSKQVLVEEPPSFLFQDFPSPYNINYEEETFFLQYLHDHHSYTTSITEAVTNMPNHEINHSDQYSDGVVVNGDSCNKICDLDHGMTDEQISVSMKRSTKFDHRQRKIATARGPRGRRMRLSLEVAREFFHLQDMLGFDRASTTLQWLLNKSKAAIKEVASSCSTTATAGGGANTTSPSSSTTFECRGNDEVMVSSIKIMTKGAEPSLSESTSVAKKKKKANAWRKVVLMNPVAIKESRAKARERARELTREKTRIRLHQSKVLPCLGAINNDSTQEVRSCCPFVTGDQEQSHNLLGDYDWSSPIVFNYLRHIGMPQEQCQSTGFQFNVNP